MFDDEAFREVYDFLLTAPTPDAIINFSPSPEAQAPLRYLLDTNKEGKLSWAETIELDEFGHSEHLMRMLKIFAQMKIAQT